jgi:signal transduction histidine kinase
LEAVEAGLRRAHPTATVVIAFCGLVPVLGAAAATADTRLLNPLVLPLVVGAAVSNVMDVRFEGRLWVSGSFLCCLMAAAVLGPSAGAAVALGSEVAAWAWSRYRVAPFVVNGFGAVAPTWMAGLLIAAAAPYVGVAGVDFDLTLAAIACLELAMNILIVSTLMGLHEGCPLLRHAVAYRRLGPFLAAHVVLLVAITEAYRQVGIAAAVFLIVVMLLFTFVVRLFIDARERATEINELAASRGRLVAEAVNAEDRARRKLARQLHDDALQALLSARQDLEEAIEGNKTGLTRADAAVRATVIKLRDAVFELHPAILDYAGLEAALAAIAGEEGRRNGFAAHVSVGPGVGGIHDDLVFSLARELVTNAARHAMAANVWITVARDTNDLRLQVRDDGQGFDNRDRMEAVQAGHIGLASSAERVGAVGGRLEINTRLGAGTSVRVQLPIRSLEVLGSEPATPTNLDA